MNESKILQNSITIARVDCAKLISFVKYLIRNLPVNEKLSFVLINFLLEIIRRFTGSSIELKT